MTDDRITARIEASANEQVPNDVENASTGPQPMLCPPACAVTIASGIVAGYLASGGATDDAAGADVELETDSAVQSDASVNEIITAIDG